MFTMRPRFATVLVVWFRPVVPQHSPHAVFLMNRNESNRKATNRNRSNQKANPAPKNQNGKQTNTTNRQNTTRTNRQHSGQPTPKMRSEWIGMSVIPRFIPNAHEWPRLHLPHLKYEPGAATVELRFRPRPQSTTIQP